MVKHNNIIPNIHCHKKYLASSRGPLKVKLALNQASRKKSRRLARAAKAAAIAPAPLQKLHPIVHCPTQRYSHKQRLGRGFTLDELKAAKIHYRYARTIGILVDHRRKNHSQESLDRNVARLLEYQSKLVVLSGKQAKAAAPEVPPQFSGTLLPLVAPVPAIVMETITEEMKNAKVYTAMRVARKETRVAGKRVAVENRKKKE